MAVGDFLTLCGAAIIVFLGARAVARQTWDAWLKPVVLRVWPARPPEIMSSATPKPMSSPALSLETDAPKAPDRPMMPVPTKEQMLDIFKVLRAAGVSREAIGPAWRAAGLPLNNNLWSDAAPPDDEIVTPYAGRVTKKDYYPDRPDLEYKPLSDSRA
jgi:hypothetical protein